jgi:hypothetical protein
MELVMRLLRSIGIRTKLVFGFAVLPTSER